MTLSDLIIYREKGEQLRNKGFTTFPLLSQSQILQLNCIFEGLKNNSGVDKAFYTSIWSENEQHRKMADEQIKAVLFPELQKHFKSIQPVFANFMVKASAENSALLPHQDWSFVNEPEFDSATVWVPLIDVDYNNGNLQVVSESHMKYTNYIRPRFGDAPFNRNEEALNLVDIPMKAGGALILNSRLIHASPPNLSGKARIAASIVIAPSTASLKHWVEKNSERIEYDVDESFFWKYSCYETPV